MDRPSGLTNEPSPLSTGYLRRHHLRGALIMAILVIIASVLLPSLVAARTWHVPAEAPTIQAGIDSAGAGDDVLVAPGQYFEHDIAMKGGVWVHSEQGANSTIVEAEGMGRGFVCLNAQQAATLEGFTIRNGRGMWEGDNASGGGVRCVDSHLLIRGCVIIDCLSESYGGGLAAYDSDIEIEACRVVGCFAEYDAGGIYASCWPGRVRITDCEIVENEAGSNGGGIGAIAQEVAIVRTVVSGNQASWGGSGGIGCFAPVLLIQDCLVTHNANIVYGGASLTVDYSSGTITGCTVANNVGYPPPAGGVGIFSSDIELERTIIANHGGLGLECGSSDVTVRCCDLYGNDGGNDICGDDLGGNFSEDPLFCDAENGDFSLDAMSPCLPGNHPDGIDCGLIGALGHGCGAVAVEEATWGRIKMLYHNRP